MLTDEPRPSAARRVARWSVVAALLGAFAVGCWLVFGPSPEPRFETGPECIPASVQDC